MDVVETILSDETVLTIWGRLPIGNHPACRLCGALIDVAERRICSECFWRETGIGGTE